jgi:hypothetical protein
MDTILSRADKVPHIVGDDELRPGGDCQFDHKVVSRITQGHHNPPQLEVTNCDFNFSNSTRLIWNMKSSGTSSRFRFKA